MIITPVDFAHLPPFAKETIIIRISPYLSVRDVANLAGANTTFRRFTEDNVLWGLLLSRDFGLTPEKAHMWLSRQDQNMDYRGLYRIFHHAAAAEAYNKEAWTYEVKAYQSPAGSPARVRAHAAAAEAYNNAGQQYKAGAYQSPKGSPARVRAHATAANVYNYAGQQYMAGAYQSPKGSPARVRAHAAAAEAYNNAGQQHKAVAFQSPTNSLERVQAHRVGAEAYNIAGQQHEARFFQLPTDSLERVHARYTAAKAYAKAYARQAWTYRGEARQLPKGSPEKARAHAAAAEAYNRGAQKYYDVLAKSSPPNSVQKRKYIIKGIKLFASAAELFHKANLDDKASEAVRQAENITLQEGVPLSGIEKSFIEAILPKIDLSNVRKLIIKEPKLGLSESVNAQTLINMILLKKSYSENPLIVLPILIHEATHVGQYQKSGLTIWRDYRKETKLHGYHNNRFEREAHINEWCAESILQALSPYQFTAWLRFHKQGLNPEHFLSWIPPSDSYDSNWTPNHTDTLGALLDAGYNPQTAITMLNRLNAAQASVLGKNIPPVFNEQEAADELPGHVLGVFSVRENGEHPDVGPAGE